MADAAASDCDPRTTGALYQRLFCRAKRRSGRQLFHAGDKTRPAVQRGGSEQHPLLCGNNEAVHRKLGSGDEAKSSRCERSDPSAEVLRLTLSLKARTDELPSGRFHAPPSASIRVWLIIANVCVVITASEF